MKTPDIVLLALGVGALVLTGIGVGASDAWSGERTVSFETTSATLAAQGPAQAGGGGARFNWTVPDNATSARLQVTVVFEGQSFRGGSSTVTVRVVMPDGRAGNTTTAGLAIPAGSSDAATVVLDVEVQWAQVPHDLRDLEGHEPAPRRWAQPLDVHVAASEPADAPLADYSFMASVNGTVQSYHA